MEKQLKMMEIILYLYEKCKALIEMNMPMALLSEDAVFEKIISIKYDVGNKELYKFEEYRSMIDEFYQKILAANG